MKPYDDGDIESILRFARRLTGKRLSDVLEGLDAELSGTTTKGRVGLLYERYFGIPPNSLAAPDFGLAGVELKIVPIKGPPSARRVKERMFITQINYRDMLETPFATSHLRAKTRGILLIFYEWIKENPIASFKTLGVHLWNPKDFDDLLLDTAYGHVRMKVLAGEAHTISEADTRGVGAATKGAGGEWVAQPNSEIKAKRRAFAFKPPFMTAVWQDARGQLESVPDHEAISALEFENRMIARASPYVGMNVRQIASVLGVQASTSLQWLSTVARRMMGAREGKRQIEELTKMGVKVVTTRIDERGTPREDVSFRAMNFSDVAEESWDSSTLRDEASHLLFTVFRHRRDRDLLDAEFLGAFFWRPSDDELTVMKAEWEIFRDAIKAGKLSSAPKASQTRMLHIRPHGRDRSDLVELPTGGFHIKSSFWLNKDYVGTLIDRYLPLP